MSRRNSPRRPDPLTVFREEFAPRDVPTGWWTAELIAEALDGLSADEAFVEYADPFYETMQEEGFDREAAIAFLLYCWHLALDDEPRREEGIRNIIGKMANHPADRLALRKLIETIVNDHRQLFPAFHEHTAAFRQRLRSAEHSEADSPSDVRDIEP